MSPEYSYLLKVTAANQSDADEVTKFLKRMRGVVIQPQQDTQAQLRSRDVEAQVRLGDITPDRPMGDVVKAWREARNITPSALAKIAGIPVTKDYISKLEHHRITNAGTKHRKLLASALDIPDHYLTIRQFPDSERSNFYSQGRS